MLRKPPPQARAVEGTTTPAARLPFGRLAWYALVSGIAIVGPALIVSEALAGVHPILMFMVLVTTLGGALYVASRVIASRLAAVKQAEDDRQHAEHGDHRHQSDGVRHAVWITEPDLLHGSRAERD